MRILKETEDYIAVYKPAGVPVETRRFGSRDLEHEVMRHVAGGAKGQMPYVAVINRIDQPVEGIVLFAKNKNAAANLSKQLTTHRIRKIYYAVVRVSEATKAALLEDCQGGDSVRCVPDVQLTDLLVHDKKNNVSRVAEPGTADTKQAILSYGCVTVREEDALALLKIQLETGRHHQIRVQLAHAGMPIAGDAKYGGMAAPGEQLALCSAELHFQDPVSGKACDLRVEPEGAFFAKFRG